MNDKPLSPIGAGRCDACGREPLHILQANGQTTRCTCAFGRPMRDGREYALLCRDCAIAYDYGKHGTTKIKGAAEPTPQEVAHVARVVG